MNQIKELEILQQIFASIQATNSRLAKEAIITKNKDNMAFATMLHFLYSPYIRTGIQAKKLNKFKSQAPAGTGMHYVQVLLSLATTPTGADDMLKEVNAFINSLPESLRDFVSSLVTKSLKIGISTKIINKAWGSQLVPEFNVMLAKKYADHCHKLKGKDIIITPKLDGLRAIYSRGQFFTRKGLEIHGMCDLVEAMKYGFNPDYVYDGELLVTEDLPSNAKFAATQSIVRGSENHKKGVAFHIFDSVPVSDWDNNTACNESTSDRKRRVKNVWGHYRHELIQAVPICYEGKYNEDEITKALAAAIADDYEGVMINVSASPYQFKRTDQLLKVKVMNSCDLKIQGCEEGQGRLAGNLGALIVNYKGNEVKVGSGYSDDQRQEIWAGRAGLNGRVVEVQYFEESKNQNGGISLRFPVFLRFREDKTEPSYN